MTDVIESLKARERERNFAARRNLLKVVYALADGVAVDGELSEAVLVNAGVGVAELETLVGLARKRHEIESREAALLPLQDAIDKHAGEHEKMREDFEVYATAAKLKLSKSKAELDTMRSSALSERMSLTRLHRESDFSPLADPQARELRNQAAAETGKADAVARRLEPLIQSERRVGPSESNTCKINAAKAERDGHLQRAAELLAAADLLDDQLRGGVGGTGP